MAVNTLPETNETRHLLKLAIPISLSQLAVLAMQLVDTAFVGHLSPEALGALSVGNAAFSTVMVTAMGTLFGLEYLISHAVGARELAKANSYFIQGLYLGTAVAIVSIALLVLPPNWFPLFGIPAAVAADGKGFLDALAWSLLPWLWFTVLRQYLQALNNPVPALVTILLANGVNALGNWVFIHGHWGFPAMGVRGSAVATLVARTWMAAALAAYLFHWNRKKDLRLGATSRRLIPEELRTMIRLGLPIAGQLLLEVGVFATATLLAGKLGAVPLAAHQIVLQIASFTFMIPLGIASAASVRVAQALGAKDIPRARRTGWISVALGAAVMACCGVAMLVAAEPLLRIFTGDAAVIAVGLELVLLTALFQLFDGTQVVATGALRGIGNTRASLIANLVGHWVIGLPIGAGLCFAAGVGVRGLWIGLSLGLIAVAVALVISWKRLAPKS